MSGMERATIGGGCHCSHSVFFLTRELPLEETPRTQETWCLVMVQPQTECGWGLRSCLRETREEVLQPLGMSALRGPSHPRLGLMSAPPPPDVQHSHHRACTEPCCSPCFREQDLYPLTSLRRNKYHYQRAPLTSLTSTFQAVSWR